MPGLKVSFQKNLVQGPRLILVSPTTGRNLTFHACHRNSRKILHKPHTRVGYKLKEIYSVSSKLAFTHPLFQTITQHHHSPNNLPTFTLAATLPTSASPHPPHHFPYHLLPPVPNFQHNSKVPPPTLGYGQVPRPQEEAETLKMVGGIPNMTCLRNVCFGCK